jgi:hypothetical protein
MLNVFKTLINISAWFLFLKSVLRKAEGDPIYLSPPDGCPWPMAEAESWQLSCLQRLQHLLVAVSETMIARRRAPGLRRHFQKGSPGRAELLAAS